MTPYRGFKGLKMTTLSHFKKIKFQELSRFAQWMISIRAFGIPNLLNLKWVLSYIWIFRTFISGNKRYSWIKNSEVVFLWAFNFLNVNVWVYAHDIFLIFYIQIQWEKIR